MAHFVMSSLQSLLFVQMQDLRFWPVSTMVVLDVRKPKPGLARGLLGTALHVVAGTSSIVVFAVEAAAVSIEVGCIILVLTFAPSTSLFFVAVSSGVIRDVFSDFFGQAVAAGSCWSVFCVGCF